MRTIRILVNGVELDYVEKTLSLKKDNNSFSLDFKVAHSQYPFLIIENQKTVEALGTREITSINKTKVIDVTVFELGEKYKGELHILSYLNGFRKCNLKYASEILPLLNKKIADFMPIISVIPGETNPEPFVEESDEIILGSSNWETWPQSFMDNVFPQTLWSLPSLKWLNKFGINLTEEDGWFYYENELNRYNEDNELIENTYTIDGNDIRTYNRNVVSPQVFLLTPLFYIFDSIGFKIKGQFINNAFVRKILMLSTKTNLTKTVLYPQTVDLDFTGAYAETVGNPVYAINIVKETLISTAGSYTFKFRFQFPGDIIPGFNDSSLRLEIPGATTQILYASPLVGEQIIREGETTFTVDSANINQNLRIIYRHSQNQSPISFEMSLSLNDGSRELYQMHPTIDFSRYVPDWTVAKYLNELKKLFNISITPNDFKKEIVLDFNELIDDTESPEILNKSLKIDSYDATANTSFTLKYGNDSDNALFITKTSVEDLTTQTDIFNKVIQSDFKLVPFGNYTSEITEDLEDKSGVGLMIYDPFSKPFISESYNSQTLSIEGDSGIYQVFWKNWLKFRLNASSLEISGPFTDVQIQKIQQAMSIYVDNQRYRILSLEFSEAVENENTVKFYLESVNF